MPPQGPFYFATLCIPQLDGFVNAAAGKHGSVGAPRNSVDIVRVPAQGRLANRRLPDFASRRLPDFDGAVVAATGYLIAIWTEGNTRDRPVKSSIVSTHHTFENKQE